MPRRIYTAEHIAFVADNMDGRSNRQLAQLFSEHFGIEMSETQMKMLISNHKLKRTARAKHISPFRLHNDEQLAFLKANVEGISNQELADMYNAKFGTSYTRQQIKGAKMRLGLSSGLTGYFPKGHVPLNKGIKGVCAPGCEKTWFKKGHQPANYRPVGSERISVDGYIEVKVKEPNTWKLKHREVYEAAYGPIPKAARIIFLDGNKLNVDISNLKMVDNDELLVMNRHKLFYDDPELTAVGVNMAKVIRKTHERKKRKNG